MSLDIKKKINKRCEKSFLQIKVSKVDLIYLLNPGDDISEFRIMDSSKKRRRRLVIFFIIIILAILGIVVFGFFCSEDDCALSRKHVNVGRLFADHHYHQPWFNSSSLNKHKLNNHLTYEDVLNDDFQNKFDINKFDVMVITETTNFNKSGSEF